MKTDRLPEPSRQAAERALSEAEGLAGRQQVIAESGGGAVRAITSFKTELAPRKSRCPEHGDFREAGFRLGTVKPRDIWRGCPECAVAKSAADQEGREAQARQLAMDRRQSAIDSAAIPLRFRTRDFASFVADTNAKLNALAVARDYAEQFPDRQEKGQGLVFSGLPGTGKSHLAASIMLALIDGRRQVRMRPAMSS